MDFQDWQAESIAETQPEPLRTMLLALHKRLKAQELGLSELAHSVVKVDDLMEYSRQGLRVEEAQQQETPSPEPQRTTGSPTTASHSAAQERASIPAPTPALSLSDQPATPSGPVARFFDCVHQWTAPWAKDNGRIQEPRGWCQRCGALMLSDRTAVPDARQPWSISPSPALPSSVETSEEAGATSSSGQSEDDPRTRGVDSRIAIAGAFWERGEPLTDEVWATHQYVDTMAKRYANYTPPQRVGGQEQSRE